MLHPVSHPTLFAVRMPAVAVAARPAPSVPTLLRDAPAKPMQFDGGIDALARHIHALRDGAGIELGPEEKRGAYPFEAIPGFNLWTLDEATQGRRWLGFVAIQGRPKDALEAALRRTEAKAAA